MHSIQSYLKCLKVHTNVAKKIQIKMSPLKASRREKPQKILAMKQIVRKSIKNPLKYNVSKMVRTRSEQAAAKCKIFRLNDDCLLEIFSHLPTVDLCALKDSCRRFNALANYTAKIRFGKEKVFKCTPNRNNRKDLSLILRHFGQFVVGKLRITTTTDKDSVHFWSLLYCCTAVKKLKLCGINVNRLTIYHPVKRVLQNLIRLTFRDCPGSDWRYACIINASKNLTIFNNVHGTSDKLLSYIANERSPLEKIWLRMMDSTAEATFVENMSKLGNLTKLTSLIINCHNYRITPAIDVLVAKGLLRKLMLVSVYPDEELARALSNFSNLDLVFSTSHRVPDSVKRSFENLVKEEEMAAIGYVHRTSKRK